MGQPRWERVLFAFGACLWCVSGQLATLCLEPSRPTDAGVLLGISREILVLVEVFLGNQLIANGTASYPAYLSISSADLGKIPLRQTQTRVGDVSAAMLQVKATFTPADPIVADETLLSAATSLHSCYSGTGDVFDADVYQSYYSTAFWAPGVGGQQDRNLATGVCPGPGESPSPSAAATASVSACFPANPALETCRRLVRCSPLEFQKNAGLRSKHQNFECETLEECTSGTDFEKTAGTPTSNRLCVTRVEHCFLAAGEVAQPGTDPVTTCEPVVACSESEYTKVGATAGNQPLCVQYSGCDDTEYEVQPKTRQQNTVCLPVSEECARSDVVPVRLDFDDTTDPALNEFYETSAPTPSSDRTCAPTRICTGNETLSLPATSTSDRECRPLPPGPVAGPAPPPKPPPGGLPALVWNVVAIGLGGVWIAVEFWKTGSWF